MRILEETPEERVARKKRQLEETRAKKEKEKKEKEEKAAAAAAAAAAINSFDKPETTTSADAQAQTETNTETAPATDEPSSEASKESENVKTDDSSVEKSADAEEKGKDEDDLGIVDSDDESPAVLMDPYADEAAQQWLQVEDDEFWLCEKCTLLNSKVLSPRQACCLRKLSSSFVLDSDMCGL